MKHKGFELFETEGLELVEVRQISEVLVLFGPEAILTVSREKVRAKPEIRKQEPQSLIGLKDKAPSKSKQQYSKAQ